jgi:hypothetical protein
MEKLIKDFVDMKQRLIDRLTDGMADKAVWDFCIEVGKALDLTASVAEMESYYKHYGIGELGHGGLPMEPVQNTRAEAIP